MIGKRGFFSLGWATSLIGQTGFFSLVWATILGKKKSQKHIPTSIESSEYIDSAKKDIRRSITLYVFFLDDALIRYIPACSNIKKKI